MDPSIKEKIDRMQRQGRADPAPATTGPDDIISGRVAAPAPTIARSADVVGYEHFLARLTPGAREALGDAELRAIYAKHVADADEERKSLIRKQVMSQAAHAARSAAGLVSAESEEELRVLRHNSEIVTLQIDLPPTGDQGELPDIGLRVDGRVFLHGHSYQMTEAQAASMREQIHRLSDAELLFKGQNTRQRRWLMGRALGAVEKRVR
jgi:hypothetical protein